MEKKQKLLKNYAGMLLIAAAVFGLDQWTKLWIRNHLALRETITPIPALGNFFRIIHWKNTGIAFGLFQGNGWILTTVGIVIVIGIILFSAQTAGGPAFWHVAMAMELGGALGNLADRIVLGAFILVIGMWSQEKKHEDRGQEDGHDLMTDGTNETDEI